MKFSFNHDMKELETEVGYQGSLLIVQIHVLIGSICTESLSLAKGPIRLFLYYLPENI